MKKTIVLGAILLSTLGILAGCNTNSTGTDSETAKADPAMVAFAECLTDSGMKMYGTERCPHCQNQKKEFGDAFESVAYIDCDKSANQCAVAGVTGYPTWISGDGTKLVGQQSLEALGASAGCTL